jgi:tRNA(Ile2) C34 agmatinyltransferase TiaS
MMLTKAWMRETLAEERRRRHLWKYVRDAYEELSNGHVVIDHTYRQVMHKLAERGVAKSVQIQKGRRAKYDYELTAYGMAVCEKLQDYVREQIRLESWRRRALSG